MTSRDQQPESKASVFGQVDQAEMIARLEQAPADETETDFFQGALAAPQPQAARALAEGIRAFTGTEPRAAAPAPVASEEPGIVVQEAAQVGGPVTVVGRIGDDPAAKRAFILFGPAGVHRPA